MDNFRKGFSHQTFAKVQREGAGGKWTPESSFKAKLKTTLNSNILCCSIQLVLLV